MSFDIKKFFDGKKVPGNRNTCVDAAEKAVEILKQNGISGATIKILGDKTIGQVIHKNVVVDGISIDSKAPFKSVFGKDGKPTGETREDNTNRSWFISSSYTQP